MVVTSSTTCSNDNPEKSCSPDWLQWLEHGEAANSFTLSQDAIELFSWFLLGTPALGVSVRSNGFIDCLKIRTTLEAEAFLAMLEQGRCKFETQHSSAELVEWVTNRTLAARWFWEKEEFVSFVLSSSSRAVREIEELGEYRQSESAVFSKEQTSIVKRHFLKLDSLFRHIRNALAHGCFFEFELNSEKAFFLFDLNTKMELSAVMSLTHSRLKDWHTYIEKAHK